MRVKHDVRLMPSLSPLPPLIMGAMAKKSAPAKQKPRTMGAAVQRRPTFIRAWRKFRDLTQDQCGEIVGKDRTTFGRIERGIIPYSQDFLELLSSALGCSPGDLLITDPFKAPIERELVAKFRIALPETQRIVKAALRVEDASEPEPPKAARRASRR